VACRAGGPDADALLSKCVLAEWLILFKHAHQQFVPSGRRRALRGFDGRIDAACPTPTCRRQKRTGCEPPTYSWNRVLTLTAQKLMRGLKIGLAPEGAWNPPDNAWNSSVELVRGTRPTTRGTRPTTRGTRLTTRGTRPTTRGTRPTTRGTRPTTRGTRPTTRGTRPTTLGTRPTTLGTRPTTLGARPTTLGTRPTTLGTGADRSLSGS
jgi:hypothetical protein